MFCEGSIVDLTIEIDGSLHCLFVHWLSFLLFPFVFCLTSSLLIYIWKLRFLLWCRWLLCLQLIDRPHKWVLEILLRLLIWHTLLGHLLQVALQEVKPLNIIPWFKTICIEHNDLVALECFSQEVILLLDDLGRDSFHVCEISGLMTFLGPICLHEVFESGAEGTCQH